MTTAIQGVFIRSYEERSEPKPHTVYKIEIQAHVRSWWMWRRYSEFDDLNTELTKATGSAPPCPLPPKHKFSLLRSHTDAKVLDERKVGLENYLRAIVGAKEDKWRETFAFRDFLGIPIGKQGGVQGGPPTQFTSASWLDEHLELQAHIRDIRADINKRDAWSDRGDVGASHKANVAAKQKLAGVLARVGTLGTGLRELGMGGMSEGELQRRTDMVGRLQDDCETLGRMVTVARMTSRGLGQAGGSLGGGKTLAPESDREVLMGGNTFKAATRVFGAAPPAKETDQTRPLDDHGLLGLQQAQIQQQDDQLSQITTILQRQKQLGIAIGSEIELQNELLDSLTAEVDHVQGKLKNANKQMNRLGK